MQENLKVPKKLEGSRIRLEARKLEHAEAVFQLIEKNREHLKPWMPWEEKTRVIGDTLVYLKMAIEKWGQAQLFDYTLFIKETNVVIGGGGLHSLDWNKKSCEVGYWIGREHQGQGLVSEALQLLESLAFSLGFHRCVLACDPKNERSKSVAVRNGYRFESLQIDECFHRGEPRDTLRYIKLLNAPRPGSITENLPYGFSIRESDGEEFGPLVNKPMSEIFDDVSLMLRLPDILTQEEKDKLKVLNEKFSWPYRQHLLAFHKDQLAGWSWGYQDSRESFYMVNSAVLPEFRGRGIYSALLDVGLKKLKEKGFQRIWSRHQMTNSSIIVTKLKKGFHITATELSDVFGNLVHLTYFTNSLRRDILDFRSGFKRPSQEVKTALKIEK